LSTCRGYVQGAERRQVLLVAVNHVACPALPRGSCAQVKVSNTVIADEGTPDDGQVSLSQKTSDLRTQPVRNRFRDSTNAKQPACIPDGLFFRYSSMLTHNMLQ
jgi:hypothetical protein